MARGVGEPGAVALLGPATLDDEGVVQAGVVVDPRDRANGGTSPPRSLAGVTDAKLERNPPRVPVIRSPATYGLSVEGTPDAAYRR
jgi:hypothetical protein